MLPRPALGTQGAASLHGYPGAASSGGPYCPAWLFYRCCGGHPHLSRSQFQHAHCLRAPQRPGPSPGVQLAKCYCVGAACYARAERSKGKKTERYPLTPWQEHHWWIHLGWFLWNRRGTVNTAGWYSSVGVKGLWKEDLVQSQSHSLITVWPCRRQLNAQSPGFLI